MNPKTISEPLAATESPESIGKHYFKQAWAYSQRIERDCPRTSHTVDLYSTKLQDSRRKLREKCVSVLLVSCSFRRKAEELLWKKGFYELTQKSKSNKQALDGSSLLYRAYSEHLSMAVEFYTNMLAQLEERYQLPVTSMDHSQLAALDASNADAQWLREAAYRCLLYLGDLARYRVDIGGMPYTAVTHYLNAISLDPTNGAPFNQLAALSGDKHEGLDAVYYYMRSISSAKPFLGAEVNLKRQLHKTSERLEALKGTKERATETNIREATQSLLLARLVTLQHMLLPSEGDAKSLSHSPESIASFCEVLLSDLEECLNYDLQLFRDMCPACVHHVLSSGKEGGEEEGEGDHRKVEELACLPSDLLLKVVAMCILSSTRLRRQGSALTQTVTSFTISIFSLLLHHSCLRLSHLTHLTVHTLTHGTGKSPTSPRSPGWAAVSEAIELPSKENMIDIFLGKLEGGALDEYAQQTPGKVKQLQKNAASSESVLEEGVDKLSMGPSLLWGVGDLVGGGVIAGSKEVNAEVNKEEGVVEDREGSESKNLEQKVLGVSKKKKREKKKVVDRRRRQRRRPDWHMSPLSSDEEESERSDSSETSECSSSGDDSESPTEEEEEEEGVDRIDSLSETSLSDVEEDESGRGEEMKVHPDSSGGGKSSTSGAVGGSAGKSGTSGAVGGKSSTSGAVGGSAGKSGTSGAVGGNAGKSGTSGAVGGSAGKSGTGGAVGGSAGKSGTVGGSAGKSGTRGAVGGSAGKSGTSGAVGDNGGKSGTSGAVGGSAGKSSEGSRPRGKRQIVLAANFGLQTTAAAASGGNAGEVGNECVPPATAGDDRLFQTLLLQTRHQAALHLACSLAAEDSYLMSLKVYSDWLTEHSVVVTVCAQGSPSIWSRLATLLNLLPLAQEIISASLRAAFPRGVEWSQTNALDEDVILRGFVPLSLTHQQLQFEATSSPDHLEQACNRICVLHKFGQYLSRTRSIDLFQWEPSRGRFVGPVQREREENKTTQAAHSQQQEKAAENRSKLMKAMAERRLQVEVDSLVETSAQQEATVFTPYLLPDAHSLCTGLHLVRKLISSEKFIVVVAKSVIDSLDGMKKGKENYAAREAIKFLERSLQGGGGMVRVQAAEETLQPPGTRKPHKMDLNTWRYSCLVDCALYFTHTFAERGSSYQAAGATLLLDQSLVKMAEDGDVGEGPSSLAGIISEAQLNGVPIDTVVRFHSKWQQSEPSRPSSRGRKPSGK